MTFNLATTDEILAALGQRLRAQRLIQILTQSELARMAGISLGALRTLERSGHSSLETLIRVAQALGLTAEMDTLFVPKRWTIAHMEQIEAATQRQRARRQKAR